MVYNRSDKWLQIIQDLQKRPQGFAKLMELELFNEIHGVPAGTEPNPEAPRNRACRLCAAEILLWGLKDWWIRERAKGFLEESITKRKDCPEFNQCTRQKDDPGMTHLYPLSTFFLLSLLLGLSPRQRM
jgi:E3 ubiquitin-protein ligase CHFR